MGGYRALGALLQRGGRANAFSSLPSSTLLTFCKNCKLALRHQMTVWRTSPFCRSGCGWTVFRTVCKQTSPQVCVLCLTRGFRGQCQCVRTASSHWNSPLLQALDSSGSPNPLSLLGRLEESRQGSGGWYQGRGRAEGSSGGLAVPGHAGQLRSVGLGLGTLRHWSQSLFLQSRCPDFCLGVWCEPLPCSTSVSSPLGHHMASGLPQLVSVAARTFLARNGCQGLWAQGFAPWRSTC